MTRLAFVDTETTGLHPIHHEVWEVGLIVREEDGSEQEHHWLLPVDLLTADPFALSIGRFHERHPQGNDFTDPHSSQHVTLYQRSGIAKSFARLTNGAHLVGACVSFDAERLARILYAERCTPSWHYHLVDVEALAAGYLADVVRQAGGDLAQAAPPWDSGVLSRAVGVDPGQFQRHTALGDARWAMAIYDAVMA